MGRDRSKKGGFKRHENVREENKTLSSRNLLTFSFKDMDFTQPKGSAQSFQSWADDGLLFALLDKLKIVSQLSRDEAEKQQIIKVYGDIPNHSNFSQPKHISSDVSWAVFKGIGGQVTTIAGYIVENTFYGVFLDKEHRFWPSNKKKT